MRSLSWSMSLCPAGRPRRAMRRGKTVQSLLPNPTPARDRAASGPVISLRRSAQLLSREPARLPDPVLALDASGEGQVLAHPARLLRRPGGDLVVVPDAEFVQLRLVQLAD